MYLDGKRYRLSNLAGFLACSGLMAYAYYAQFVLGLEPCPLCIFQRVAMIALGLVFLAAALQGARGVGRKVYGGLVLLAAGSGVGIAARHVWLQNLPPDLVPSCGPGLDYMLDVFPLGEALKMAFTGSGECAEVDWTLLGLSMPTWTLLAFAGLGLAGLLVNFSRSSR
ncbi:MAG: disulfide bond formation protein B [Gammaproteobacteria bacterium]|nr:disulfide bond formation protein B [Gammaproteobacteria bacterium]